MKEFLKVFCLIIINILTTLLLIALVFTFNFGDSVNKIASTVVKETINNQIVEEKSDISSSIGINDTEGLNKEISKKIIEYIEADKDLEELIEKYIDIYSNGIIKGEIKEYNLKEDIVKYLEEHKDELNKKYDADITDKDIDELKESDDLDNAQTELNNAIKEVREEAPGVVIYLFKVFNFLKSTAYKIMCFVLLGISLVLNALLLWSLYKWLLPIGIDLVISGTISTFISIILNILVEIAKIELDFNFSMKPFIITSVLMLLIGIVMLIINAILSKKFKKEEV